MEEPLLGPHEADGDALVGQAGELGEPFGVGLRVGDDEIGGTERPSIASSARAAGELGRKRPRSATKVSASETSGLKTIGRPRATRRAAARSRCPG
jgi:hypothetical protein